MEDIVQVKIDDHVYTVKRMVLTPENLRTFWEKSRQFKTLFSTEVRGDFKRFLEIFLSDGPNGIQANGLFWVVDDFLGLMYMTDMIPGVDAKCHISFFDKRIRGREPLVKAMLHHAFERYGFHRLSLEIALYINSRNSALLRFAENVGFKHEGRKRSAAFHDGVWYDVNLFGILKEEIIRTPTSAQSEATQSVGSQPISQTS